METEITPAANARTGTADGSWRNASERQRHNLIQALIALSLNVARRAGEDEQAEARIRQYAAQLMAWPERLALAVLAEAPKRSIYWPAWKELEDLKLELEERSREQQRALPSGDQAETFAARATRLGIHRRLGTIGVQRWREVIDRHRALADHELLAALDRLEAGRHAFDRQDADDHAPFTSRKQWESCFAEAMASLRNPDVPHLAREELLKIGETIEQRREQHAEAMGWTRTVN